MLHENTRDPVASVHCVTALGHSHTKAETPLKFMNMAIQPTQSVGIQGVSDRALDQLKNQRAALGFSDVGVMSSRSAMLPELTEVFAVVPHTAQAIDYRNAIVDDNILHKASASNRDKTSNYLHRLYGLDPTVPLFRELRRLAGLFPAELTALASLLALAREPVLRASADMVISLAVGSSVGRADFETWVREFAPGRYSQTMYRSFSHNLYASFFQMGYLGEAVARCRLRKRPEIQPATVAYAAFLDWLNDVNGISLLKATHSRVLDLPRDDHLRLLSTAGQLGLMRVANAGGVLHLDFSSWMKSGETRLSR